MTLDAGNTSRETILVQHERRGTDTLAMIKGNGDLAYDEIVRDNYLNPDRVLGRDLQGCRRGGKGDRWTTSRRMRFGGSGATMLRPSCQSGPLPGPSCLHLWNFRWVSGTLASRSSLGIGMDQVSSGNNYRKPKIRMG